MSKRSTPLVDVRTLSRASHSVNRKTGESFQHSNTCYGSNPYDFLSYLARESLIDYDTGKFAKKPEKGGLVESYCVAPKDCSWAADLQQYAQEISENDKRKNSRFGREFVFVCPNGMKLHTFLALMRRFSFWMSHLYNTAPFVFVHDPKVDSWDEPPEKGRNLHAHVFLPTREIHPWGLGNKLYCLDYGKLAKQEIEGIREHWARDLEYAFTLQNEKVEFDHRSYERRGIKRKPQPKIGNTASQMEQRGQSSDRMKVWNAVQQDNERLEKLAKEQERLKAEIDRLGALPNKTLPDRCVSSYSKDDHVNKCCYTFTQAHAERTYEWLKENYESEPMLESLFNDFELLLDSPRPEEETIPELPPNPTIGDLFESVAMQIDRLELRTRPRPHHARKWAEQQERSRGSPVLSVAHKPDR